MDVGRALIFVFHDASWPRKFLIGLALFLVPSLLTVLVSPGTSPATFDGDGVFFADLGPALLWGVIGLLFSLAVYGYGLGIARQVAAGTDLPLPAWTDWGRLFADGLKAVIISFVWLLIPLVLVGVLVFGSLFAGSRGNGPGDGGAIGIALLLGFLTLLTFLALAVVLPAAVTRLATTGSIGQGINVPAVLGVVRANPGDYLVILMLVVVGGVVFGIINVVLSIAITAATGGVEAGVVNWPVTIVSSLFTTVVQLYLGAVTCHLYGQAYYRANRGPVLPTGASAGQLT